MILCMDFSGQNVKIMGLVKEKKELKLTSSLELPVSDLPEFFREHPQGASKHIEEIRVSAALEDTFHKILVVPDLKKKMLHSAVEAEVIKAVGNEYQFKEKDLGEVLGPGNKVDRKMMTAGLKRDALEQLSQSFAFSRVKPQSYTTYPVALQALLEKLGVLSEKPLAFIEVSRPACRIVVFKEEEIRLTRELPVTGEPKDLDKSALAKDIYRTLLFYNDAYPKERVDRLLFAGSFTTPEIKYSLKEKTGAELVRFDPESAFQTGQEVTQVHPGCLGLALLDVDRLNFGFVPFSVQEKRKIKNMLALCSSASIGVILIFVLVMSRFSLDLSNLDAFHGGIKGEIRMREDRLREMPLEFVSQFIEASQPPWSEILLELAAVVPPGVALKTFSLKNAKRVWRGEVSGMAHGSDEINSLLKVEETQNNFVKSPLFDGVRLTERDLQGQQVEFKIIYQLNI